MTKELTWTQQRDAMVQRFGYMDVDHAISQLVEQGKHNTFIGRVVDLTAAAVGYRIQKMGIKSAHGPGGPNFKGGFKEREKLAKKLGYADLETMYRTLYFDDCMNLRQIGKIVGYSDSNVSIDFRRLGIPRMTLKAKIKQKKLKGLE